jgi:hypothetical protein
MSKMIKIWLSGGVVHIEGVESLLRLAPQHLSIEPTAPQVEAPEPAAEPVRATYVDGPLPYVKFNGKAKPKAEEPTVEVPPNSVDETPAPVPPARKRGRPRKDQSVAAVPETSSASSGQPDQVQQDLSRLLQMLMAAGRQSEVLQVYRQFRKDATRLGQVPRESWPEVLAELEQL